MMPQRKGEKAPENRQQADAMPYDIDEVLELIPATGDIPYDMIELLNLLADDQTLFELQPEYGASMIIALARFGGVPCMVTANQPNVQGGAITHQAAEKACHFIQVANDFNLPLVSLLDNPGVMPGPDSERLGILKSAAKMFSAQRQFCGQKIVITLRKAFGFGSSVMGMNPWDNQAINLALPSVALGGIPAIGGAEAAKASDEEKQQLQNTQSQAWIPADAMAFDKIIDPRQLRNEIIEVLHRN